MKFIILHDFQRSSQLCPDVFASGIILIILYSQADIEMLKEYITFSLFMSWYNHFWILDNSSWKNSMNVVNCTLLNYLLDIDYWCIEFLWLWHSYLASFMNQEKQFWGGDMTSLTGDGQVLLSKPLSSNMDRIDITYKRLSLIVRSTEERNIQSLPIFPYSIAFSFVICFLSNYSGLLLSGRKSAAALSVHTSRAQGKRRGNII